MLGNRVGDVNSFTADDLRLFATLASHASIAWRTDGSSAR
jgi:hypothetical protein